MRRVRRHPDFVGEYLAQLDWLVERRARSWIANLMNGVAEITALMGAYPDAGQPQAQEGSIVLRKIIFPNAPFLAWYAYDAEDRAGDVWLVRLFHLRQQRPKPDVEQWLPPRGGTP